MSVLTMQVPKSLPTVGSKALKPRESWDDKAVCDEGLNHVPDDFQEIHPYRQRQSYRAHGPQR